MAAYEKRGSKWRAKVALLGRNESQTFPTKAEAIAWASAREVAIRNDTTKGVQSHRTVDEAFSRYATEVSEHKKGKRLEKVRLNALAQMEIDGVRFGSMNLVDVTPEIIGAWRDMRLKVVLGSTINRDLNLLSHVFSIARDEWRWIAASPTEKVRRPKEPPPRDYLYSDDEIDRVCVALGFDEKIAVRSSQRVAVAFLFAIESAMRAGEILAFTKSHIVGRTVRLTPEITKNGFGRDVPLSKRAVELLELLPPVDDGMPVFDMASASLDALFRKGKTRAGIEGATFHDTRHLAITRLAKKFPNVLDLARMTGHRDLKKLMIYYNESAENMAALLDA